MFLFEQLMFPTHSAADELTRSLIESMSASNVVSIGKTSCDALSSYSAVLNWNTIRSCINDSSIYDETKRAIVFSITDGMMTWLNEARTVFVQDARRAICRRIHACMDAYHNIIDWGQVSRRCCAEDALALEHRIDWSALSRFNVMRPSSLWRLSEKLDWDLVCRYQYLPLCLVRANLHRMNWSQYSQSYCPNVEVLKRYHRQIDWNVLSSLNSCSHHVVNECADYVNWRKICIRVVRELADYMMITMIDKYNHRDDLTQVVIDMAEGRLPNSPKAPTVQWFFRRYERYMNPFMIMRHMRTNCTSYLLATVHGADYYNRWSEIIVDIQHGRGPMVITTNRYSNLCDVVKSSVHAMESLRGRSKQQCHNEDGDVVKKCERLLNIKNVYRYYHHHLDNVEFVWHSNVCVVCIDENKSVNVILFPCKHAVLCTTCITSMLPVLKCPYCREQIKDIVLV